MNARTAVLIFAVALIGIGLILTLRDLLTPSAPPPRVTVAHAVQQIEPYTVIEQNMIETEDMTARSAKDQSAWEADQVVGMMSADLIRQGDLLTAGNAQPAEQYRESGNLQNELVSFTASIDHLVAGQVKPGQLINIYGISKKGQDAYTVLIEPNVRVVRVFAGAGRVAGSGTPEPNWDTGNVDYSSDRNQAGSLVTVELSPEKAYHLIDSIGAQSLEPYVTLAGTKTVTAFATPPASAASLQPTVELPDIGATMTAIWESLATPAVQPPKTGGGGMGR